MVTTIRKEITKIETRHLCDGCQTGYEYPLDAQVCEKKHQRQVCKHENNQDVLDSLPISLNNTVPRRARLRKTMRTNAEYELIDYIQKHGVETLLSTLIERVEIEIAFAPEMQYLRDLSENLKHTLYVYHHRNTAKLEDEAHVQEIPEDDEC